MNVIDKKFTLEISEAEARELSDIFHFAYKNLRDEYNKDHNESTWKKAHSAQVFRNDIAALINVRYCGEDA